MVKHITQYNVSILEGVVSPISNITPEYVGQLYRDTHTDPSQVYISINMLNTGWVKLNDIVIEISAHGLLSLNGVYEKDAYYKVISSVIGLTDSPFSTPIYLKSTNGILDTRGFAEFYNPKYTNVNGSGIWNNICKLTTSNILPSFDWMTIDDSNEYFNNGYDWDNTNITANNGATGKLLGNVKEGYFLNTSNVSWVGATSFIKTGDPTKSADITALTSNQTYTIGSKVIWGGKVWVNISGNIGTSLGETALSSTDWSVSTLPSDYVIVYDEIEYDISNRFIISRKDCYNNYVHQNFNNNVSRTAIKHFQWGNSKTRDNKVFYGYFENVNFRGSFCASNNIEYGYVRYNVFGNTCEFSKNNIIRKNDVSYDIITLNNLVGISSEISNNYSEVVEIQNTNMISGSTSTLVYKNSITNNTLSGNYSKISNNSLRGDDGIYSSISSIFGNMIRGNYSNINNNILLGAYAEQAPYTIRGSNIYGNVLLGNKSTISFNNLDGVNKIFISLLIGSESKIIYNTCKGGATEINGVLTGDYSHISTNNSTTNINSLQKVFISGLLRGGNSKISNNILNLKTDIHSCGIVGTYLGIDTSISYNIISGCHIVVAGNLSDNNVIEFNKININTPFFEYSQRSGIDVRNSSLIGNNINANYCYVRSLTNGSFFNYNTITADKIRLIDYQIIENSIFNVSIYYPGDNNTITLYSKFIPNLPTITTYKHIIDLENNYSDYSDIKFGTTIGTKIGTSSNQKLAFYGNTPITKPTTSTTSATYVNNGGVNLDTFDGYTLPQIVKILKNLGLIT